MALVQISQMSYINTLINKINIYSTLCVCVCMHMCNLKGEQYTTKQNSLCLKLKSCIHEWWTIPDRKDLSQSVWPTFHALLIILLQLPGCTPMQPACLHWVLSSWLLVPQSHSLSCSVLVIVKGICPRICEHDQWAVCPVPVIKFLLLGCCHL